ncbi:MAG: hypothetical protein NT062_22365 [Proteobacteria bacterium]|nr:hypothetical protein [Pseudomonadota bacterium]
MAKMLIDECVLPLPLTPVATGKPAVDVAIARLAAWELSAYTPNDTPYGDDYERTVKAANAAPKAKLLVLLDDAACTVGNAPYDEARVKRLSPANKKAYQKAYEAALHASKGRRGFLRWLMAAVLPNGRARLLEIATTARYAAGARVIAAQTLFEHTRKPAELRTIARALDPHTWKGEGADDIDVLRIYIAASRCWHEVDAKQAYTALADLVTPKAIKTPLGVSRASVVIDSLGPDCDPRWAGTIAEIVEGDLEFSILPALTTSSGCSDASPISASCPTWSPRCTPAGCTTRPRSRASPTRAIQP